METKQEKLIKLDNLVLDRMIELVDKGETNLLPELTSVVGYLAKNNLIADKESSTIEDEIRSKVKQANKRRNEKK